MDHNAATQVLPLWVSQTLARLDLFHPDSYGRALVDVLASKTNENGSVIVSCGGKGVYKMAGFKGAGKKEEGKMQKKGAHCTSHKTFRNNVTVKHFQAQNSIVT